MKTVPIHKGTFFVGILTGTAIATLFYCGLTFWFMDRNEHNFLKIAKGMVTMAEEASNAYDDIVMLKDACGEKCAKLELKTKGDF